MPKDKFALLSPRKQYASHRRADLLHKLLRENKDFLWMYSYEVDVEKLLKRKLGYKEWDENWDVGLHLKDDDIYLMLSKKNNLGSFQEIEKVKYTEDLEAGTWLLDCLAMHKSYLSR